MSNPRKEPYTLCKHGSRYYRKAIDITRLLTAAYEAVLAGARPAADAHDADEGATDAEAGRSLRSAWMLVRTHFDETTIYGVICGQYPQYRTLDDPWVHG